MKVFIVFAVVSIGTLVAIVTTDIAERVDIATIASKPSGIKFFFAFSWQQETKYYSKSGDSPLNLGANSNL